MDTYNKYYNNKKNNKKNMSKYLTKILISIIFLLGSFIFIKISDNNKKIYENIFLNDYLSFNKINEWYQNKFGDVIPLKNITMDTNQSVFKEDNESNIENYLDGKKFIVDENYYVTTIQSGIVVFMGEKEKYGKTIIIQGIDGVDIWYCNIEVDNINLYDYVKKNKILGRPVDNTFYLVLKKDNNFISYEEYNKN